MRVAVFFALLILPASSGLGQMARGTRGTATVQVSPAPGPMHRRVAPFASPFWYPFFSGDYSYAPYTPAPATTNVVIVQQPPEYVVVPQAPPESPRLEVREYNLPPSAPPADAESPTFAIALKDGSVRSAVAVTVQDDIVHYVEPDGRHQRVSLGAVDAEATRRLNRERKLNLQLPAPER